MYVYRTYTFVHIYLQLWKCRILSDTKQVVVTVASVLLGCDVMTMLPTHANQRSISCLTFDVWIDWIETYVLICVVLRFYICQRSSAGTVQQYNSCRVSLCSCRVTNWFSIFIKLCPRTVA